MRNSTGRHANKLLGLDGFLMKRRMATLGSEAAASHEMSRSQNDNILEFHVNLFFKMCFVAVLDIMMFFFFTLSFSCQILKKKGSSSFLQRLERCGPITVAVQLRVRTLHIDTNCEIKWKIN